MSVGVALTLSFWPSSHGRGDRIVAVAVVLGQRAGVEERVPRLHLVGRAPDHPRLARGVRMQLVDRKQESVDRHVVDVLELAARASRRTGSRRRRTRTILRAPLPLTFLIARSSGRLSKLTRLSLRSSLGQIHLRVGVVDGADEHVLDLGIRVDDAVVEHHFVEAEVRALGHAAHFRAGKLLLESFLMARPRRSGVAGFSACGKRRRCAANAAMTAIAARLTETRHGTSPENGQNADWTSLSQRRLRQALASERDPIDGGHAGIADADSQATARPNRRARPSVTDCIASTGATRRRA